MLLYYRSLKLEHRREMVLDDMRMRPQSTIRVSRMEVGPSMIKLFNDPTSSLFSTIPFVEFEGEKATDLDGLTRELFSLFWEYARYKYFEGSSEMVPRVDPQTCQIDLFTVLGRIISYGYLITGYFPVFMAKASVISCICDCQAISDDAILNSFLNYIDAFEKESACRMMQCQVIDGDEDIITGMLSRCKCFSLPTSENIRESLIECGKSELICRPTHALRNIANGMKEVHSNIWDCINSECFISVWCQHAIMFGVL